VLPDDVKGEVGMKNNLPILSAIFTFLFVIIFCSSHITQVSEASSPEDFGAKEVEKREVVKHLGNLPAFFIENQGQTAEEVRYYFKGSDAVYFTDSSVIFQKLEAVNKNKETRHPADKNNNADPEPVRGLAYRLEFLGANPTTPQARKQLEGRVNIL
jgi:hypothetical protein